MPVFSFPYIFKVFGLIPEMPCCDLLFQERITLKPRGCYHVPVHVYEVYFPGLAETCPVRCDCVQVVYVYACEYNSHYLIILNYGGGKSHNRSSGTFVRTNIAYMSPFIPFQEHIIRTSVAPDNRLASGCTNSPVPVKKRDYVCRIVGCCKGM